MTPLVDSIDRADVSKFPTWWYPTNSRLFYGNSDETRLYFLSSNIEHRSSSTIDLGQYTAFEIDADANSPGFRNEKIEDIRNTGRLFFTVPTLCH